MRAKRIKADKALSSLKVTPLVPGLDLADNETVLRVLELAARLEGLDLLDDSLDS